MGFTSDGPQTLPLRERGWGEGRNPIVHTSQLQLKTPLSG